MKNYSITTRFIKQEYNGTYRKVLETYIDNTKDVDFDRTETTLCLIEEQVSFLDSLIQEQMRSAFISYIFINFIKRLQSKEIAYKISKSQSDLYRLAITNWLFHDYNKNIDYSNTLQEWIKTYDKNLIFPIKKRKVNFLPGKNPLTLFNLFPRDLYSNRIISHLLEYDFLYYRDLINLVGCSRDTIDNKVRDVINTKYPNLVLRHKEQKEYCNFSINKKIWEIIQKEVYLKNVLRKE